MLVLRAVAATGEALLAAGARGASPADARLAAAARAAIALGGSVAVGAVTALVWAYARRGAVPVGLTLFVPLMLVVADVVPRGLGPGLPPTWRRGVERSLTAIAVVLWPLVMLQRGVSALLIRSGADTPLIALRHLGGWIEGRPRRGTLDVSEAGLVERIARFAAKTVRDVLVPHVDVCAVPDAASVGDVVALVRERGFSRLPVFHERLFNTLGTVSSFDLLGVDPALPVTTVMRDPFFVPETKPLPELLATLQAERLPLALVVDEYGGFVGLVTVGGLVLDRLGRVPRPGDGIRAGRVRFEVTRASARAVLELRVAVD